MTDPALETRIAILVDNNVRPGYGLLPEHGFSALVERGGTKILFDTGQGKALPWNARILGEDLTGLDLVVLSHGHYDHTGGLPYVLRENPGIRIVCHPKALDVHLSARGEDPAPHDIGTPWNSSALEVQGAHFDLATEFKELLPGLFFSGYVPRRFGRAMDGRLLVPEGDGWRPDPMEDDASLALQTGLGWVVLLGCAHAGVRNILAHLAEKLDITEIWGVVGGTHLGFGSEDETFAVIDALESHDVRFVATAHCTGLGPSRIVADHFGDRFHSAYAGAIFNF